MNDYIGINTNDGTKITGLAHLRQSIRNILTTPLGSRVMRRNYGSLLPDLIDRPLNAKTAMQIMAATVMAINNWEPRVKVENIRLQFGNEPSDLYVDVALTRLDGHANSPVQLQIPITGYAQ